MATARVVPDLRKALEILSDQIQLFEDMQLNKKSRKKNFFFEMISKLINYMFLKDFTNHRKKSQSQSGSF